MNKIFVYGTLKSGHHNHDLIGNSKQVAEMTVLGFKMYQRGIPYMIRTDNHEDKVLGEVYEVDDRTLKSLDQLEGHPNWYRREDVSVIKLDTDTYPVPVQGYVYIAYLPSSVMESKKNEQGAYVF